MSLEFWIAWRYLVTKRKEKFIGLISIIAVLGVVVGVAALVIVTAVMSGFRYDLHDKIIGNFSHVTVSTDSGIEDPYALIKRLQLLPHVQGASPFIAGQALVRDDKRIFGVKVRGIDPETIPRVSKIKDYLIYGDLARLDVEGVIIGKELAGFMDLHLGKNLPLQVSLHKIHDLTVEGIFSSGMYEYDTELIFLHLDKVKQMLGLDNVTGIAIKLDDPDMASIVKKEIRNLLGYSYHIKTWMELNANFFAALQLEKIATFIMLSLIVLVAAFNIISTLIVMVVQKSKDIGVLKAIGMPRKRISRIFTYQGLIIGFIGVASGVMIGWFVCLLLKKYQFVKLPADIYYLDHLPVSLSFWPDMALIIAAALAITVLSTIYPALRAGRLNPVDALRYE